MSKFLLEIESVLEPNDCYALANRADSKNYSPVDGLIDRYESGSILDNDIAKKIYDRINLSIPQTLENKTIDGINDFLRIHKFKPNTDFIKSHRDSRYLYNDPKRHNEKSNLIVYIFLNDNFAGGTTIFYGDDHKEIMRVNPKVGKALIFDCDHFYSEEIVSGGACKYVLKSEVMVKKEGSVGNNLYGAPNVNSNPNTYNPFATTGPNSGNSNIPAFNPFAEEANDKTNTGQYVNTPHNNPIPIQNNVPQYGNAQYNTQYGNTQYGNTQYNPQYTNTQHGNTQYNPQYNPQHNPQTSVKNNNPFYPNPQTGVLNGNLYYPNTNGYPNNLNPFLNPNPNAYPNTNPYNTNPYNTNQNNRY